MRLPARRSSLVPRALVLAALAVPVSAGTAHAGASAPTFPASTTLTDPSTLGGGGQTPTVAIDANGDAIAAWSVAPTGSFASNVQGRILGGNKLQVSYRPAGGTFSTPVSVSTATAYNARVAIDAAGDATVIWTETPSGGTAVVRTVSRPAGGAFSAPVTLSDPAQTAISPSLAMAADGSAIAVWDYYTSSTAVVAERRRSGLGTFAPEVPLSYGSLAAEDPVVSMNAQGDAAVTWTELNPSNVDATEQVWLARTAAGSDFTAATSTSGPGGQITSPTSLASESTVVLDDTGVATVAYEVKIAAGQFQPRATAVSASGVPGAEQTLGPASTSAPDTVLAADHTGRVTAAWVAEPSNSSPYGVEVATASPGGAFSTAVALDSVPGNPEPSVAADAGGDTLVAWSNGSSATSGPKVAFRAADSAVFQTAQTIDGPTSYGTAVAIGAPSIATLLYMGYANSQFSVQASSTSNGVTPTPTPAALTPTPIVSTTTGLCPGSPSCGSETVSVVAPVFSIGKVTLTGKKPKKGSKKVPPGPKLVSASVTSTVAASVTATITKASKGIVKGTTCVAPPKKKAKGKQPKSCTRQVLVGKAVTKSLAASVPTVFAFTKKTPVGTFTLTVTGKSTAGITGAAVKTALKIK